MKKIFYFFLQGCLFVGLAFLSQHSLSQRKSQKKHSIKYISLSVGIFHDEEVPLIPKRFNQKGTFRKFVKLQYNSKEKKIRFEPRKEGTGTLFIINKDTGRIVYEYRFGVQKTDLNQVVRNMKDLLNEITGITIKIINNRAVVDGQVLLPSELKRIYEVVRQFGDRASSLVILSIAAQKNLSRFIEREINNPEITVRTFNGVFLLEGWAKSEEEKSQAFILAQAYMPDVVLQPSDSPVSSRRREPIINRIKVRAKKERKPVKKLLEIHVHYVELSKNYNKGFGFQWTPNLGDGTSVSFTGGSGSGASGIVSTITGTINNLLPKLNWAKSHGYARVLKSTSIIIQDGETGEVKSLSKVPYQTEGSNGQLVTKTTDSGVQISLTPVIMGEASDSIELKAHFSISAFTGESSGGPIVETREIKTKLVVKSGDSAAVGGLISNNVGKNYNKLPPGAENPIISLYASKDFRSSQSQFVIFVTPKIKSSASVGAEKIKKKFKLK